jgi:hypothetical protein
VKTIATTEAVSEDEVQLHVALAKTSEVVFLENGKNDLRGHGEL